MKIRRNNAGGFQHGPGGSGLELAGRLLTFRISPQSKADARIMQPPLGIVSI